MTKKLLSALIVLFVVFFVLPGGSTIAATPAELQQKIQEAQAARAALQAEQVKLQTELNALNSQGKTLQGAVKSLDATKRKLANDIKLTQSKINSSNLNIQSLENSINTKEQQVSIHQKAIATSIQKIAEYDRGSFIGNLLGDENINDLWVDQGNLTELQDTLSQSITSLQTEQTLLTKEKEAKEKTKLSLVSLQSELGGQKKVVEQTQANKNNLLTQTKSQEAAYQKLLADNIAREKKFEADLFNYEAQLKVTLDPKSIPSAKNSILSWPVASVRVTQQFGRTSSSGRLYASGTHNGMDFGVSVGTAILAAKAGTVSAQGNTDLIKGCYSYGRWVMVQHENGLSTLYAHLSATLVSTGQTVTTGQPIAYSGGMPGGNGSGYSTGPHLHFGLYATQAVQVQPYTTSINCRGTSIPIAPPQGYLDPLAYLPSL